MEPWPCYPFWEVMSSAGEGWKVERPEQGMFLRLPINPKENLEEVILATDITLLFNVSLPSPNLHLACYFHIYGRGEIKLKIWP